MTVQFSDLVCVVTGASSGLGRRIALDLARQGAVVVGVARREKELRALAEEMRGSSPRSWYRAVDLADIDIVRAMLDDVRREHGRIDMLVNNAAYDPGISLRTITVDDYRRAFEVNFFAPVAATLHLLPQMMERGSGYIVNVCSDGARLPGPGPGNYESSKAALAAFTESVSFRAGRKGVHLHVVYPAWVPTAMGIAAVERGLRSPPRIARRTEEQVSRLVLRRIGSPSVDIQLARITKYSSLVRIAWPRLYRRMRGQR